MSMSGSGIRMLLIDECHRLSASAWDALLKLCEEPPPHLYIAFCTTNPSRVPPTIFTRAYHIKLNRLSENQIDDYVSLIARQEGWRVAADIQTKIVVAAEGSPRKALTLLHSLHDVTDQREARRVADLQDESDPMRVMLSYLIKGGRDWGQVKKQIDRMAEDDEDFVDSVIIAGRYIAGAMMRTNHGPDAQRAWKLIEALTYPSTGFDPKVIFFAAIGRVLWSGI
jgi:DNA polymerase III gamma/tau subunit